MVYCGKPSRGCQNCKTRRIKCDEVRPTCTQCKKSNRTCPGYPDEFDLIFRNETQAVKRRAQRALSFNKASTKSKASAGKKTSPPPPKSAVSAPDANETSSPSTFTGSPGTIEDDVSDIVQFKSIDSPGGIKADSPAFIQFSIEKPAQKKDSKALVRSPLGKRAPFHPMITPEVLAFMTVPYGLETTPSVSTAIPYFFRNHVLNHSNRDSQRGFLELLQQMWEETKPDSLLRKATYAVALTALSSCYQSEEFRCEGRKHYGKALQELGAAIQNPSVATSDEIITTTLLFSLYEQINVDYSAKTAYANHVHGAVALVKMRGQDLFSSPRSVHLFRAVRTQMLTAAMQRGAPIEEFPHPKGWKCDEELELNAANRLSLTCLGIPNLRHRSQQLLEKRQTPEVTAEMMTIVEEIREIDYKLEQWVHSLPDSWRPTTRQVVTEEPPEPSRAQFWTGPVYAYKDISIAQVMNEYRIARIICQSVVRRCVTSIPLHDQTESLQRYYIECIYVAQQMVSELSSTVPYLLGFERFRPNGTPREEKSARSTGAFYCLYPIVVMTRVPCVTLAHKRWLYGRLFHIARAFGIKDEAFKVDMYELISKPWAQAPLIVPAPQDGWKPGMKWAQSAAASNGATTINTPAAAASVSAAAAPPLMHHGAVGGGAPPVAHAGFDFSAANLPGMGMQMFGGGFGGGFAHQFIQPTGITQP